MNNIEKHINSSYEIDLLVVFKKLLRKAWLILVVAICLGGISAMNTKLTQAPSYMSSFRMMLEDSNEDEYSDKKPSKVQELNTFKIMSLSFVELLKGDDIMTKAAENCGADYTADTVRANTSIQTDADTGIITVSTTAANPEEALLYSNAVMNAAKTQLPELIKDSSVIIVNSPKLPEGSYAPSVNNAFVKGAFMGLLLMTVILTIKYIFEDKVENAEQLEKRYKVVVLGKLPHM